MRFNEWYSSSYEEGFYESYEDFLVDFEKRMKEEGMEIDVEKFVEYLDDLGKFGEFERELSNFFSKAYDELYVGKFDPSFDDYENTPEYNRVVKALPKKVPFKTYQRSKKKALFNNLVEKNWEEVKKIYQKWLDVIHDNRGKFQGKKYGI